MADSLPYNSNFHSRKKEPDPTLRHYQESDSSSAHANPTTDYRYLSSNINPWSQDLNTDRNQQVPPESFPDKIVKDGQVFYRHDIRKQQEEEKYLGHQSDGPFDFIHKKIATDEASPSEIMPKGFDFLLDHVRQVGSQRPIISAAIAGASIRGSSKGSTSHVIGSAINGGYFVASANGYDDKGGSTHSHIHGTGKGVSGGASAVAPDRDGEAFIQVDNSERGLSIGQSSTHNGEAFVIADVDNDSEYHVQQGDSTISFTDTYDSKKFGHSFGEAKSSISPSSKRKQTNIYKLKKENSNNKENKNGQTSSVGMGLIENIVEKVHQPGDERDVASSLGPQNDEGNYRHFPSLDYMPKTEDETLHKSKTNRITDNSKTSALDLKGVTSSKPQEKGVVGLVTYPYGKVGAPPGPGELLTQAPDTFLPPLIENTEDYFDESLYNSNLYNDEHYPFNGKVSNILEGNQNITDVKHNYFPSEDNNSEINDQNENKFDIPQPQHYHTENKHYSGSSFPSNRLNEKGDKHFSLDNNWDAKYPGANNLLTKEHTRHSNSNFNDKQTSFKNHYDFQGETQLLPRGRTNTVQQLHTSNTEKSARGNDRSLDTYNKQTYSAPDVDFQVIKKGKISGNTEHAFNGQPILSQFEVTPFTPKLHKSFNPFTTESVVYQPYSSILDLADPVGEASFFNTPYYSSKNRKNSEDHPYKTFVTAGQEQTLEKKSPNNQNIRGSSSSPYSPLHNQEPSNANERVQTAMQHPFHSDIYASAQVTDNPYYDDLIDTATYQNSYTTYSTNKYDTNFLKQQSYNPVSVTLSPETLPLTERQIGDDYGINIFSSRTTERQTKTSHKENRTLKSPSSTTRTNGVQVSNPAVIFSNPANAPTNTPKSTGLGREIKMISPGTVGSMQQLEPSEPGQPHLNVVTIGKNNRRKQFYQREGTPVEPGEKIPGAPGYRVPPGFRGRVVYGHSLPIEVESRKAIKGYNTRVKLSPQSPYQGPVFASVSGPEAASRFTQNPTPGIHITLSAPSVRTSSDNRRESTSSSTDSTHNKTRSDYRDRSASRSIYKPSKSYYQQTGNTYVKASKTSQSISRNSNGQCGYYTNECHQMNGPYQVQTLCVPKFIIVACCC